MRNNYLFLTLKVFAATGGIEKICRVAGKALFETGIRNQVRAQVYSMYDKQEDADDNRYFPTEMFRGFGKARIRFIIAAIKKGRQTDTVILSHINLLLVGWLIKKISPSTRIIMFAHGIEVWGSLRPRQKMMLQCCDRVIAVSHYTSRKIQELHAVPAAKCRVLNNGLDPFLPVGFDEQVKDELRKKYGYSQDDLILFTLTRLSSRERYKGYDKVLQAMVSLKKDHPRLKYLLAGSYDDKEKAHLDQMINYLALAGSVQITGFVPEDSLVAHFTMADIYVMPSIKEGFGIVFIEAMYYGLPVIAGNLDGSPDALLDGKLGILVDPLDVHAIESAIREILANKDSYIPNRELLTDHFSYEHYKENLVKLIA